MQLYSTTDRARERSPNLVDLRTAIIQGQPPDKGLYMPTHIPRLSRQFLDALPQHTFQEIAFQIAKTLIADEIYESDLHQMIQDAINFDAPLKKIENSTYVLELFHGPTLAFKDFGARFMARLLGHFTKDSNKELTILVATSGDTGSAVAHGFLNVPGIRVVILYPKGKVSPIQEKMLTTMGGNITTIEIDGTFDDCQDLVKTSFADPQIQENRSMTSANSINIGRLIPQTFYYGHALAQLKRFRGERGSGTCRPAIISVPSGNFGNLTAGLIAKKMGIPIDTFIAATNVNDAFPKYLQTGKYRPRNCARQSISSAMDVGRPSNFQRMLALYHDNINAMRRDVVAYSVSDEDTRQEMWEADRFNNYALDPHGAVALHALRAYRPENGQDLNDGIFLETAHPAKFPEIVLKTTGNRIEVPSNLSTYLNREKQAVSLRNHFPALRDYLLSLPR